MTLISYFFDIFDVSSMAERAIKNDEKTRNAGVKKGKESKLSYNDETEEEGGKGGRGDDNDPTSSKNRNRNRNKNKQSSS